MAETCACAGLEELGAEHLSLKQRDTVTPEWFKHNRRLEEVFEFCGQKIVNENQMPSFNTGFLDLLDDVIGTEITCKCHVF